MPAEVLYRKWRPKTFAAVVGQEHVTRTLTNAVAAGKVSHAYLFAGPRGTGKTTSGRLLAKAVNCENSAAGEPCNQCDSCAANNEGRALDMVELDAASNRGIDEIRGIREKANYAPAAARFKVYLVDEVHMLTEPAFNALLKTLEEPPERVIFILATTEFHKVPATIVSRCQRFDFRRISLGDSASRLQQICAEEGVECPQEGLELIARSSTGSMRDAINLLEQLVDSHGTTLTIDDVREDLGLVGDPRAADLARMALQADLAAGLQLIAGVRDDGVDLRRFQREVLSCLRDYLLAKSGVTRTQDWTAEQGEQLQADVAAVTPECIVRALRAFGRADLRADPLSSLPLELALAECSLAAPGPPAREEAPAREAPPARPEAAPRPIAAPAPRPMRRAREPVPVAAPAVDGVADEPAAIEAPADLDVEAIRSRWGQLIQEARRLGQEKRDPAFNSAAGWLNSECDVVEVHGHEVVVGFRFEIHLQKVLDPQVQRALTQVFDRVMGGGLTVRCVFTPDLAVRRRGGHLVQAAQDLGAKMISPEDEATA